MCRSVPQIPVASTRIFTSLIPTCGSGTSSIQSPRSALALPELSFVFLFCHYARMKRLNFKRPCSGISEPVVVLFYASKLPLLRSGAGLPVCCAYFAMRGLHDFKGLAYGAPLFRPDRFRRG